jgi:hypothetical protein
MMGLFDRWKAFLRKKQTQQPSLAVDATNKVILLSAPDVETSIPWHQIKSIIVYKRDLFTIDQLNLLFTLFDGREVNLDEDIEGFGAVLDLLNEMLAESCPYWYDEAIKEPFARSEKIIYEAPEDESGG